MTDLFTSLVDRALARAPVLQRRQPTLFEPIAEAAFSPRFQAASADTIHEENDFVEREPIITRRAESKPRISFTHPSPETEETRVADYQPRNVRRRNSNDVPRAENEPESDHREFAHEPRRSELTRKPLVREEAATRSTEPDREQKPEAIPVAPARMIETIIEKRVEREVVSEPFKVAPASEESKDVAPSQNDRSHLSSDRENQRAIQAVKTNSERVSHEEDVTKIKPRRQKKPEPNHDNHPVIRAVPRIVPERIRQQPAQPTIHVTIGRVEVRATTPPAGRVQSARPPGPKLSLEEYLRSRGKGN